MFNKVSFFLIVTFLDNMETFDKARQTTDDSIIWRMSFACWIIKATHAHS